MQKICDKLLDDNVFLFIVYQFFFAASYIEDKHHIKIKKNFFIFKFFSLDFLNENHKRLKINIIKVMNIVYNCSKITHF